MTTTIWTIFILAVLIWGRKQLTVICGWIIWIFMWLLVGGVFWINGHFEKKDKSER